MFKNIIADIVDNVLSNLTHVFNLNPQCNTGKYSDE